METCGRLPGGPSRIELQEYSASCIPAGFRGELVVLLAGMLIHRALKEMA